ncbi:cold-inducible protein YdjO-related protein [Paenibacillus roseipurpureus]|uniref:Cold-inducible protein YdjO-related protein n=1 Tax=Paenibacillus roseopurpureus TaxID=2918901 RepID=A0AA96LR67_9BACL|nr:cold-inducible protein YdjO-related protein [Paenibacillus sp. MBLB1832]WNR43315.1 cold-inducible protein YdjO-related protein [Paenibacillus sp. MBLB1832]
MSTTTSIVTEEQKPEVEQIEIWKCKGTECKAWVRKEFVTEAVPTCPLCKNAMVRSYKHVPVTAKKGNKKFLVGKKRF